MPNRTYVPFVPTLWSKGKMAHFSGWGWAQEINQVLLPDYRESLEAAERANRLLLLSARDMQPEPVILIRFDGTENLRVG